MGTNLTKDYVRSSPRGGRCYVWILGPTNGRESYEATLTEPMEPPV
jgi:hypothetical protein